MSKYKIGDVVYAVKSATATTEARCKVCAGDGKAFFKNGASVDCDYCTDGLNKVSYRLYEVSKDLIKINGVREFVGSETKYWSEGELDEGGPYVSMLKWFYNSKTKIADSFYESNLFPSLQEASAAAAAKNRNAENNALDEYWKSSAEDNDDSDLY